MCVGVSLYLDVTYERAHCILSVIFYDILLNFWRHEFGDKDVDCAKAETGVCFLFVVHGNRDCNAFHKRTTTIHAILVLSSGIISQSAKEQEKKHHMVQAQLGHIL